MVLLHLHYLVIYHIFNLTIFYIGKFHNCFLCSKPHLLNRAGINVDKSSPPLYPVLDAGESYNSNLIPNFGVLTE